MTRDSTPPTNSELAKRAVRRGKLFEGNNILRPYTAFIVFFHELVGWSYHQLVEYLQAELGHSMGKASVTRRKVETIYNNFRNGTLTVLEQEIANIAASDPALAPFLEKWHSRTESPSEIPQTLPQDKRRSQRRGDSHTEAKKSSLPTAKTVPPHTTTAAHYDATAEKRQRQQRLAVDVRKKLRPE